jgi:hypothetical protein
MQQVRDTLQNLDPNKASGPDGLSTPILRNLADEIAGPLARIYNFSLASSIFPSE